jgi:hypothetical protein
MTGNVEVNPKDMSINVFVSIYEKGAVQKVGLTYFSGGPFLFRRGIGSLSADELPSLHARASLRADCLKFHRESSSSILYVLACLKSPSFDREF